MCYKVEEANTFNISVDGIFFSLPHKNHWKLPLIIMSRNYNLVINALEQVSFKIGARINICCFKLQCTWALKPCDWLVSQLKPEHNQARGCVSQTANKNPSWDTYFICIVYIPKECFQNLNNQHVLTEKC